MAPVTVKSTGDGGSKDESRKRRNDSESSSSSATAKPSTKIAKPISPEFSEEKESKDRSGELDTKVFVETCDKIKKLFDQMLEVRKTGSKKNAAKVQEMSALRLEFSMHFLTLKKLNRLDKLRTKNSRETTSAARQRVDSFHLQLQNLLYEVLHLEKEVSKCLQFRSGDEDVDLIPVEEFYLKAPSDISKPDDTRSNPHLQRLARLEFEKIQREAQSEERKKRESEKDELDGRIRQKKEQLAKLKPQLQNILASTKSLQEYLEMPMDAERDQLLLAKYLPHPLFVIFSETRAYAKVYDENIQVSIKGDLNQAKVEFYANQQKKKSGNGGLEDQNEDIGNDADEDEEKAKKKKKRGCSKNDGSKSLSSASENPDNEKINQLLAKHPLTIQIDIKAKKLGSVMMNFKYLTHLEVVVVQVKLVIDKESQAFSADSEILQGSTIFAHLLDEPDSGETIPNPTFLYRQQKLGLDSFPKNELRELGEPYIWVQSLAGLIFPKFSATAIDDELTDEMNSKVDETICQSKISRIMSEIKERFVARLALQRQLSVLEKAKVMTVDLPIPEVLRHTFSPRIASKLRAWTSVDLEQYMALTVTQHLKEGAAVSNSDFFFRLQINRDFSAGSSTASLIALIAIKPSYPRDIPVFCLNLHWNGEHNAKNSERIRSLEHEVNSHYLGLSYSASKDPAEASKGLHYEILTLQIQLLMASLDVLLDSWSFDQMQQGDAKTDFHRDKLFLQSVKGRRRTPPLKYQSEVQIFTQ